MKEANKLPYYPRFIFNFSDGHCLSTADLDLFRFIKESGSEHKISRFKKGQKIDVHIEGDYRKKVIKTYIVTEIEIQEIKYDIDEPTYGINKNDCLSVEGVKKKWIMDIYIFLDLV